MEVEANPSGSASAKPSLESMSVVDPTDQTKTPPEASTSLMESRALSSEREAENSKTKEDDNPIRNLGTQIKKLRINKVKLSGAQKRQIAIERAKAKGEPIIPRKPRANRKPQTPKQEQGPSGSGSPGARRTPAATANQQQKGIKRVRSEGSTPSPSQNPQKIAKHNQAATKPSQPTGVSYSKVVSAIKMAVISGTHPDTKLTAEQGKQVQGAILQEIWKCQPGKGPKFNHSQTEHGMVHFHCADIEAAEWLKTVIPNLNPWEGANLRVLPSKDVAPRVRASVWIPRELLDADDPTRTLRCLKTQNEGIDADDWKVFNIKNEPKGSILVVGMDENSLKVLTKKGFKLYLGLTMLTFRVLDPKPKNAAGPSNKPAA